jgi:response regulator of citrate/malate metabolism
MDRERDEGGQYVEQVTLDSVLRVFQGAEIPVLTANEVADELGCSRPAAYQKLEQLVDKDDLIKKKVGARAVVYIQSKRLRDPSEVTK